MPSGFRVQLMFTTFQLEDHSSCSYDFVELRNGFSSSSPLIGKYCGSAGSLNFISAGVSIYITFKSDGSVSSTGFSANFAAVTPPTNPPPGKEIC